MFAAFLLATTLAASTPLTIDDYATMPTISSPQISPDGKRIVYVVTTADMTRSAYDSNLWVVDADGRNDIQLTHSTGSDSRPRWSPDGSRIAFLSDRDGRSSLWMLNASGGEPWKVTAKQAGAIRSFDWSPDGRSIAFLMTDPQTPEEERKVKEKEDVHVVGEPRRQQHLYVADVETKGVKRMSCCEFSISSFAWSPDSKNFAVVRVPSTVPDDEFRSDIFLVDAKSACDDRSCPSMLPLVVQPGSDNNPRFSPDGKSLSYFSEGGVFDWLREHPLWVMDLATKKSRMVTGDFDRTPGSYAWSADSRTIWFDGTYDTTGQIFRVGSDGSGFRTVSNVQGVVENASFDDRDSRVAFVMETLTTPPELYVSDMKTFAPRQLTHHNDAWLNRLLGETKVIHWKNPKDGLEIEGLLTLPTGYKPGTRVPLLIFVHGGPASHFDQRFLGYLGSCYAPQVLASKGFAVLRPNPRGTGGYGSKFHEANKNDWGGGDWADINAGIDKVIDDGIADPQHLGLMGWSYGGFMAAWAIGHSDRLRAISVGAPVVDLLSFHGTTDIRDFIPAYFPPVSTAAPATVSTDAPTLEAMKRGPLSFDALRAHSPMWTLRPTKAHVLIQHGEADDRVPLSQGTMLYRALDEMGVDVSMVTYPRSPHVPREPKQRIDVIKRNVEFFTKWVK